MTEMAPKSDKHGPGTVTEENADEADLQEIASVNNSLDELSNVLDEMESNTDNIMAQLRELLQSNREIRAEFKNLNPTNSTQSDNNQTDDEKRIQNITNNAAEKTNDLDNQDQDMKEC